MRGYRIVYIDAQGAVKGTVFGEPVTNISTYNLSDIDIVKMMFSIIYPDCEIIFIRRCKID